jgi:hypothetical protein
MLIMPPDQLDELRRSEQSLLDAEITEVPITRVLLSVDPCNVWRRKQAFGHSQVSELRIAARHERQRFTNLCGVDFASRNQELPKELNRH